jgi:hypothetical protein
MVVICGYMIVYLPLEIIHYVCYAPLDITTTWCFVEIEQNDISYIYVFN